MKVNVKYSDNKFSKTHKELVNNFIKFLQKEFPLKEDLKIEFLGKRYGEMSTGSRTSKSLIKVLVDGRLNRDIFRTLAHEWVHEHQRTILKREHGPDIGGQNEDEANAFAGRLIKMFEKEYPNLESKMYESKIEQRLDLLTESILLKEKESIKDNLIVEMKKIGIDRLPYGYSSLSRFIDSKTMDIHYNKHYKGYVKKLNDSLKDKSGEMSLEEIIKSINKFDDKVRNNAGGAFNHALFWKMLSPKKQLPKGEILKKIKKDFGNIKKLKDEFNKAAQDRFGSGWAWLYLSKDGKLKVMSTPNQDNPLMNVIKGGGYPLLGLDVWEHAYYLKYQNKRDEYISKFWDSVNWEFVNDLFEKYTNKQKLNESKIINEIAVRRKSKIDYLCKQSKNIDSPYCKLKEFRSNLNDDYLVSELERSVLILDQFFSKKNIGIFPKIVELSLNDKEKTVTFLELVSDFITDRDYNNDEVKKILSKLKNTTKVPEDIEGLLAYARQKEFSKYENRFVGPYFEYNPTKLQLNYHCSDDAKEKLIDTLMKIHDGKESIDFHFFRITGCLAQSFKSGSYYIKSDLKTKSDFKDENGDVLYPKGSLFEVKKMDPFIDSYLSEFFSIFKQSSISDKKSVVGDLYNQLIDKIYNWIIKNQSASNYLEKVKQQMSGIIYDNDYIVPIEYIQLYWSNKGQRGCNEKRLSIRFRIDPKFNEVVGYKFVDSDTLKTMKLKVPNSEKELVVCSENK